MEKFLKELSSVLVESLKEVHTVFENIFNSVLEVSNKMQNTKSFSRQYQKREKVLSDNAKKFIEENVKTQKDWEKFIKSLCKNDAKAALNALMIVYDNQTFSEKQLAKTVESNGIGFNAIDARVLTRIAKKYKNDRYSLNVKEINIIKSRIPKYLKQVMNEAKANITRSELGHMKAIKHRDYDYQKSTLEKHNQKMKELESKHDKMSHRVAERLNQRSKLQEALNPVGTNVTLFDLNKIKLEAESDKKKAKEKVNEMEKEYNEWKSSIHPDQLQLDLFEDGEFHNNLIHKF